MLIANQKVKVALTLAEIHPKSKHLNIDIVIGKNFYWKFFNGNVINANEGPVAMEIYLGWVLSRRVKNGFTNNNAVQNVFKITTAQIDTTPDSIKENSKSLIELVKQFWEVQDTGIHLEQDSFIIHFENSIEHKHS